MSLPKNTTDKKQKKTINTKNPPTKKETVKETDKFSPGEPDDYNAEEFATD